MAHYMSYFDCDFLYAYHLKGRDCPVTIVRVTGGYVTGVKGKKSSKLLLYFKGKKLPLACNKTNCRTLASMFGSDADAWVGRTIVLYPTTTEMNKTVVDCIRVRGVPFTEGEQISGDIDESAAPPTQENDT
jgi:hypothetical protein